MAFVNNMSTKGASRDTIIDPMEDLTYLPGHFDMTVVIPKAAIKTIENGESCAMRKLGTMDIAKTIVGSFTYNK